MRLFFCLIQDKHTFHQIKALKTKRKALYQSFGDAKTDCLPALQHFLTSKAVR